jgi:hypothetical protein
VRTLSAQSAPNQGSWQSDTAAADRKQQCSKPAAADKPTATGRQTPQRHRPPAAANKSTVTDRPNDQRLPNVSASAANSSPQRQIAAATPQKIITAPSNLFDNNKLGDNSIFISPSKWDPIKNGKLPAVPRDEDCNDMIPGGLTNLLKRQGEQNER